MPRKIQQNKITSPELLEQVCVENKQLKEDFLTYLRSTGKSLATVISYSSDIDLHFVWNLLHNKNKPYYELTKKDVLNYQDYLLNVNMNSPNRIRRLKSALSSMSSYIENMLDEEEQYKGYRGIVNRIPPPPKEAVMEKTVISEEQIEFLFQKLIETKRFQLCCAVALAVYGGARKSEICKFKVNYFNDSNIIFGSLYKTPEMIKTKGRGLQGKLLYKYTLTKFKPYFEMWMKERERLEIDSEWLFVTKSNGIWEQVKPETLNSWAGICSEILGIRVYFHAYRHMFVTMLRKASIDNQIIREILGWSDESMIQVYDDSTVESKFAEYFDENGIKAEIKQAKIIDI